MRIYIIGNNGITLGRLFRAQRRLDRSAATASGNRRCRRFGDFIESSWHLRLDGRTDRSGVAHAHGCFAGRVRTKELRYFLDRDL